MSYQNWLNYLHSAQKQSMINGRNRRFLYRFPNGRVMIEEYSLDSGLIERRAWRAMRSRDSGTEWHVELGEKYRPIGAVAEAGGGDADRERIDCTYQPERSFMDPVLTKSMSPKFIIWRIRNLPYPREVFQVQVETNRRAIIIRTTNGKFFKLLMIPELDRCGLRPYPDNMQVALANNILTIMYRKPKILLKLENEVWRILGKIEIKKNFSDILSEGY